MKTLGILLLVIGFASMAQASCSFNGEVIDTNVAVQGYSATSATPGHSCMSKMDQAVCQPNGHFDREIYPHCQSKPEDCGGLSPGDTIIGYESATPPCIIKKVYCMPDGHLSAIPPEPFCQTP